MGINVLPCSAQVAIKLPGLGIAGLDEASRAAPATSAPQIIVRILPLPICLQAPLTAAEACFNVILITFSLPLFVVSRSAGADSKTCVFCRSRVANWTRDARKLFRRGCQVSLKCVSKVFRRGEAALGAEFAFRVTVQCESSLASPTFSNRSGITRQSQGSYRS
jgi:hypothetical protein